MNNLLSYVDLELLIKCVCYTFLLAAEFLSKNIQNNKI